MRSQLLLLLELTLRLAVGHDDVVRVMDLVVDLACVHHCSAMVDRNIRRRLVEALRNTNRLACVCYCSQTT